MKLLTKSVLLAVSPSRMPTRLTALRVVAAAARPRIRVTGAWILCVPAVDS